MNLKEYQEKAAVTATYPENMKIIYPTLGLCGEAGEVAEKIKKLYRDDKGVMTDERRDLLKKELGDVLWYLAALCKDLGCTLEEVAEINIAKLASRRERGVVHGSGDNR